MTCTVTPARAFNVSFTHMPCPGASVMKTLNAPLWEPAAQIALISRPPRPVTTFLIDSKSDIAQKPMVRVRVLLAEVVLSQVAALHVPPCNAGIDPVMLKFCAAPVPTLVAAGMVNVY